MRQLLKYNLVTGLIIIFVVLLQMVPEGGIHDFLFRLSYILLPILCIFMPILGGYLSRKFHWAGLRKSLFSIFGITVGLSLYVFNIIDTVGGGPRSFFPLWGKLFGLLASFLFTLVIASIPLYLLFLMGIYMHKLKSKF